MWSMGVALISVPLLLHGLGATVFGTWVLIQTFSAVNGWFSVADLGVNVSTTKSVAERASVGDDEGAADVIATSLVIFFGLGACCALLLALVGPAVLPTLFKTPGHLTGALRTAIRLFALQVLVDLLTEGCEACLEGLQRVDLSRAIDSLRRTLVAAATAGVALSGGGLRGVAAASLACSCVGLIVGFTTLRIHLPAPGGKLRSAETRVLLSYGKDIALLRPFGILQRSMDRLVVGAALGPAAVALVEIATQLQSGADAILGASSYAVIPGASWLSARSDRPSLRQLIERGTKYSLLVTFPAVIGTIALAGPIVRIWVGARYHDAIGLVVIALLYEVVVGPLAVGANVLLGVGRASVILRAAATATLLNLGLTVLLVHVTGIVGVFQATLLSGSVLVVMLGRFVLAEVDLGLREFVAQAVLPAIWPSAALIAVLVSLLSLHLGDKSTLATSTVVGGLVYVGVALRWSLTAAERAEMLSAVRRRSEPEREADA